MNIIVIVSDTLRRDHLGCYGNKDIITPYIDEFSKSSLKFNNAYATSFPTMPCRADLYTGKYTFTYLGWNPITNEEKVLPEILQKAGYTTIAAVDTPFFKRFGYGYDRGFRDFVEICGQDVKLDGPRIRSYWRNEEDRFAPRTFIAAEKLLEYYYKEKFFLYIDTWDPHEPWYPPDYYVKLYRPKYNGEGHVAPSYWDDMKEAGLTKDDIELCHDCYCGEVTMVDRCVGKLLDKVKKLGIWDDTVIIFTSDHGFCFGEHGLFGKAKARNTSFFNKKVMMSDFYDPIKTEKVNEYKASWEYFPLYQEIARIPFIIYIPEQKSREINSLISIVDIMPTILELSEIKAPDTVQGISIVPLIENKKDHIRDFTVTSYPLYNVGDKSRIVDGMIKAISEHLPATINTEKWSMIYADNNTPVRLYNILEDPAQIKNVFNDNKEVAIKLHKKYYELLEKVETDKRFLINRKYVAN
ncbi:MAG: sulfatase [Actinobacteria bacterium]|nr:sulfatase [Actinomycetota bacterium]